MHITIITPSGDRPTSLLRQKRYIKRSLYPKSWKIKWVVIDDGILPFDPKGCEYHRREPDGPGSLERQVRFLGKLKTDFVLIHEDDDWYSPHRIRNQINLLNKSQKHLHGFSHGIYYHVPIRGFRRMENGGHASFCETAMTAELWNRFVDLYLTPAGNKVFLDLELWKLFSQYGVLTPPEPRVCLGLKGLPGRGGLGGGHDLGSDYYESDKSLKFLYSCMSKQDADEIIQQSDKGMA
jgi:hypothetical protein